MKNINYILALLAFLVFAQVSVAQVGEGNGNMSALNAFANDFSILQDETDDHLGVCTENPASLGPIVESTLRNDEQPNYEEEYVAYRNSQPTRNSLMNPPNVPSRPPYNPIPPETPTDPPPPPTNTTPEPSSFAIAMCGIMGLGLFSRRRIVK
ncbi:MAG: hypothetical protein ACRC2T_06475 [Thermoguttaceae bacterium]